MALENHSELSIYFPKQLRVETEMGCTAMTDVMEVYILQLEMSMFYSMVEIGNTKSRK